jgi:16S rRNA (guanine527-N7)-methyltransferase
LTASLSPREAEILRAGAARFGVELGIDALARLGDFVELLSLWNRRLRLTGETTRSRLLSRHVVDCLAAVPLLPARGPVADIGSGAGFPGIILACVRADLAMVLVEARRRHANFLREVARSLPLPQVRVLEKRAEAAGRTELAHRIRVAISRGLRLDTFLDLVGSLLADDGVAVAMQTPRTARGAETYGAHRGLRLADAREYRLPDGTSRCILVLARALPVS